MGKFTIRKNYWFAWQMLPGYVGEGCVPYCSPIFVTDFEPLKTGKNIFSLKFINVFYAEGVQNFSINIQVLKRARGYLVGRLIYDPKEDSDRCAIISHIEYEWIKRFCPELWYHRPPSSCTPAAQNRVSNYLKEVFFREEH